MKKTLKRIFAGTPALYKFVERPIGATPGAGNFAFLPSFSLPLFSVGGPGTAFYKNWGTQPANMYYGQQQVISGMEGVYAPGIQSQPLIDMQKHIETLEEMAAANPSRGADQIAKE